MANWIYQGPCVQWLLDSVGPCEKTWSVDVVIDDLGDHHVRLAFVHELDAVAFKLRWSGASHDN